MPNIRFAVFEAVLPLQQNLIMFRRAFSLNQGSGPKVLNFPHVFHAIVLLVTRWGIADTNNAAAFLTFFRRSFAIVGYVNADAADFKLPDHARIVRPYVGT